MSKLSMFSPILAQNTEEAESTKAMIVRKRMCMCGTTCAPQGFLTAEKRRETRSLSSRETHAGKTHTAARVVGTRRVLEREE